MADKEMNVKITADDKDFQRKTKQAEKRGEGFGQKMIGIAKMIGAAFILKKAYDGIKRLIGGMMEMADRLSDLSDITGMSTDAIQEYQYVAKIAGVSTEAVTNAAAQLTRRFQNLHSEASPISRAFRELGVEAKNADGSLRSTDAIIGDILPKLADMQNATERNALGAQMFGGAWQDLAPILAMGAEGIEKIQQEARDLGIVMSKDSIEAANELRMAKVRLQESSAALGRELGSVFLPILTSVTEGLLEMTKQTRDLITNLKDIASDEHLKWWEKLGTYVNMLGLGVGNASDELEAIRRRKEAAEKAAADLAAAEGEANANMQEAALTVADYRNKIKDLQEEIEGLTEADKEYAQVLLGQVENYQNIIDSLTKLNKEIKVQRPELKKSVDVFHDYTVVLEESDEMLSHLMDTTIDFGETVERNMQKLDLWSVIMRNNYELLAEAAAYFGQEVAWASVQGAKSMKDFSNIVQQTAKKNIAAYLAKSVAAAISAHVGMGPLGLITAGIAAGAVAAMFNTLIPSFAAGGAVSGPTLALVGEGPGVSRSNPEFIGTARQLGQMRQGVLTARVSRGDLLFILNEGNSHNKRTY